MRLAQQQSHISATAVYGRCGITVVSRGPEVVSV